MLYFKEQGYSGEALGDELKNFQNIIGSYNYGDVLIGDDKDNKIIGENGKNNIFVPGGGSDILYLSETYPSTVIVHAYQTKITIKNFKSVDTLDFTFI